MKTLNTDDIFFRNLSISLLELLNTTVNINVSRDNTRETYQVPFMYNYGTDEGFLRDFYVGLPDNCQIPVAEGTYDTIPRGIITLTSFQVRSSELTNRFVRGQYTDTEKNEMSENVLSAYSAQLYSLPLLVTFDLKVITASINQAFKIAQNLLSVLYSYKVMYFQYLGLRIPAQFFFPDTERLEKKYSFNYSDNNKLMLSLTTDIETYFPSFESTSKRKASNIMERILTREFNSSGVLINSNWTDQETASPID